MKKITYKICVNNLGDYDPAYATKYCEAVKQALILEFPDFTIDVNLNSSFSNAPELHILGEEYDMREDVNQTINNVSVY